ncbi:hypothetical protein IWQ62_005971 [Dispira parvispora]|uniref:Uncharacterized protein n=1 Tax=Dispira parvispora TaxID=1520584 RepID=A0A9W8AIY7_9FUNG|nr:hypothetical protein IWQ62_005971 [Dispira parvispora]
MLPGVYRVGLLVSLGLTVGKLTYASLTNPSYIGPGLEAPGTSQYPAEDYASEMDPDFDNQEWELDQPMRSTQNIPLPPLTKVLQGHHEQNTLPAFNSAFEPKNSEQTQYSATPQGHDRLAPIDSWFPKRKYWDENTLPAINDNGQENSFMSTYGANGNVDGTNHGLAAQGAGNQYSTDQQISRQFQDGTEEGAEAPYVYPSSGMSDVDFLRTVKWAGATGGPVAEGFLTHVVGHEFYNRLNKEHQRAVQEALHQLANKSMPRQQAPVPSGQNAGSASIWTNVADMPSKELFRQRYIEFSQDLDNLCSQITSRGNYVPPEGLKEISYTHNALLGMLALAFKSHDFDKFMRSKLIQVYQHHSVTYQRILKGETIAVTYFDRTYWKPVTRVFDFSKINSENCLGVMKDVKQLYPFYSHSTVKPSQDGEDKMKNAAHNFFGRYGNAEIVQAFGNKYREFLKNLNIAW